MAPFSPPPGPSHGLENPDFNVKMTDVRIDSLPSDSGINSPVGAVHCNIDGQNVLDGLFDTPLGYLPPAPFILGSDVDSDVDSDLSDNDNHSETCQLSHQELETLPGRLF